MYRLNIVSTNPSGSVQQQQQAQGQQVISSVVRPQQQQPPPQLALVQTGGSGGTTTTIIGLTSLNALNATTITGLVAGAAGSSTSAIAAAGASNSGSGPSTATTKHILKAATTNNNISIVKIVDDIMLKAVKVEPLPMDTGGGGGGVSMIPSSATTSGGVTVTAIPASVAPMPPVAAGTNVSSNGSVTVYASGKRRLESNEEWISSPSPGSVPGSAPPLSPSPGSQSHTYTTTMSNGYSSPMSTGSYDPYSPNGKMASERTSGCPFLGRNLIG
ncbi:AAEL010719-PA [Aedes aegypti]|uniref:AAEL010719-PA n=1 Tax=Aedes aegypti TaxID=7159 RepID=Q16S38_AEDAE|nr:AAEL010719-PA [Aedes aegypti]